MEKNAQPDMTTVTLPRGASREIYVTAQLAPGESSEALFARVAAFLAEQKASILSQEVFGIEREVVGPAELPWPVTWIEEGSESSPVAAGTQVWALAGARVEPIERDGRIVGTLFEDDDALYCRLGGLIPRSCDASRGDQARDLLEVMEEDLRAAGFDFSQVVRTWFYNDRILSWYEKFNDVRSDFFRERDLFSKVVPASTGVGGANSARAALTSGLLAARAKAGGDLRVEAVPSPQQCPALEYGSSFSRAVELTAGGLRRLYVSGTASIAPDGRTVCEDDVDGQVARTMDVVYAILESRGMTWHDAVRAIAYFRSTGAAPRFVRYCAGRRIAALPVLSVQNVICRDDLLFEIEIDAVQPV